MTAARILHLSNLSIVAHSSNRRAQRLSKAACAAPFPISNESFQSARHFSRPVISRASRAANLQQPNSWRLANRGGNAHLSVILQFYRIKQK
jgi:hypothetical protein